MRRYGGDEVMGRDERVWAWEGMEGMREWAEMRGYGHGEAWTG